MAARCDAIIQNSVAPGEMNIFFIPVRNIVIMKGKLFLIIIVVAGLLISEI